MCDIDNHYLYTSNGFDIVGKGERVLAGPGVVGHEYGWCWFPVMLSAPEPEAPEFVCERECEGEGSRSKLAQFD